MCTATEYQSIHGGHSCVLSHPAHQHVCLMTRLTSLFQPTRTAKNTDSVLVFTSQDALTGQTLGCLLCLHFEDEQ